MAEGRARAFAGLSASCVAGFGGGWAGAAGGGAFLLGVCSASSGSGAGLAAHLLFSKCLFIYGFNDMTVFEIYTGYLLPWHLPKHKNSKIVLVGKPNIQDYENIKGNQSNEKIRKYL